MRPGTRGVQDIIGSSFNYRASCLPDVGIASPYVETLMAQVQGPGKDLPRSQPSSSLQGLVTDLQALRRGRMQKDQHQNIAELQELISLASYGLTWGQYPQVDMKAHTACSRILDTLQDIKDQREQDMQKLRRCGLLTRHSPPCSDVTSMPTDVQCGQSSPQQTAMGNNPAMYISEVDASSACQPGGPYQGFQTGPSACTGLMATDSPPGSPSPFSSQAHSSGGSYQAITEMRQLREAQQVKSKDGHAGGTKKLVCQEIKRILRNRNQASHNVSPPDSGDIWNVAADAIPGSHADSSAGMSNESFDHQTKGDTLQQANGICSTSTYIIKNTFVEPADNPTDACKVSARNYFSEQPLRSYTLSRENLPICKPPSREALPSIVRKPLSMDDLPRVIKALSQEDLPIVEPMDDDDLVNGNPQSSLDAVMQAERTIYDLQDRGYMVKNTFIEPMEVNVSPLEVLPASASFRSEGAHVTRPMNDSVTAPSRAF